MFLTTLVKLQHKSNFLLKQSNFILADHGFRLKTDRTPESILKGVLPIHLINTAHNEKAEEFASIDKVVRLCAILLNLGGDIVSNKQT